nr:protein of unknown function (DUF3618) [uncultured bacterium]
MVNTTVEIKRQIAEEKTQLGENLNELETRARDLVDWRARFRKDPKLMLGVAFGGGLLLSRMLGGRGTAAVADGSPAPATTPTVKSPDLLGESWHRIEEALVGAASAAAIDLLGDLIPRFKDHLKPTNGATHQS